MCICKFTSLRINRDYFIKKINKPIFTRKNTNFKYPSKNRSPKYKYTSKLIFCVKIMHFEFYKLHYKSQHFLTSELRAQLKEKIVNCTNTRVRYINFISFSRILHTTPPPPKSRSQPPADPGEHILFSHYYYLSDLHKIEGSSTFKSLVKEERVFSVETGN